MAAQAMQLNDLKTCSLKPKKYFGNLILVATVFLLVFATAENVFRYHVCQNAHASHTTGQVRIVMILCDNRWYIVHFTLKLVRGVMRDFERLLTSTSTGSPFR